MEIQPVLAYGDPASKVEELLCYPGQRPEGSFMTDGEYVMAMPEDLEGFTAAANDYLQSQGLPGMEGRIPVLAYGANASPNRLRSKMKKFGNDSTQPLMQTVPHIAATVHDMAAVWHGQPGQVGATFAELYNGEEVQGINLHAHVAFLTIEQLAAIHTSEGVTYSAARVEAELGSQSYKQAVVAYVALDSKVLLHDGKPILVDAMHPTSDNLLAAMTVRQASAYMLHNAGDNGPTISPTVFIESGIDMKLVDKKQRQSVIGKRLQELGLSRNFAFTGPDSGQLIGRADFTSLPGIANRQPCRLPEMVLADIRPDENSMANKTAILAAKHPQKTRDELRKQAAQLVDPARMVSRRAHDELAVRLRLLDPQN